MTSTYAPPPLPSLAPASKAAFLRLAESSFGLRLSAQQAERLDQAVALLAGRAAAGDAERLLAALESGRRPDLLEELAAALTIGETHFFRVTPQIEALRRVILPDLVTRRATVRRLLLWSAGCSTGEEAYTLAILVREMLPAPDVWDVQLLATDINRHALAAAESARYGEWSFRDTPIDVRQRYFVHEERRWRLIDPIRRMVRFAHLNLADFGGDAAARHNAAAAAGTSGSIAWPTVASFDLIMCRNVTIYFAPEMTQQLYTRFAASLAPDGWLVLGPSDPPPTADSGLMATYAPGAVLWRKRPDVGTSMMAPLAAPASRPGTPAPQATRKEASAPGARRSSVPARRPARSAPVAGPQRSQQGAAPIPTHGDLTTELERTWHAAHAGDRGGARVQAGRLAQQHPAAAEPQVVLGLLSLEEEALEAAVDHLRRATFLDASNVLAHFWLGHAYQKLGQGPRAAAAFSHARRLAAALPDDAALPGGHGLTAADVRRAVSALLGERAME